MKKIYLLILILTGITLNVNAETNRIFSGNENAKITIIAYESLTCSHCADFHKIVYPKLKKDFIDTGHVKLEFRHFPLDIAALNAAKIAQCKKDQSLEILESLYFNQQDWIKGSTIEEVNKNLKLFVEFNRVGIEEAGFEPKQVLDFLYENDFKIFFLDYKKHSVVEADRMKLLTSKENLEENINIL